MDSNPPTAADYANSAAYDARDASKANEKRIAALEAKVANQRLAIIAIFEQVRGEPLTPAEIAALAF